MAYKATGADRACVLKRTVIGLYGSPSTAVLSFLTAARMYSRHFRFHIIIASSFSVNAWPEKIFPPAQIPKSKASPLWRTIC